MDARNGNILDVGAMANSLVGKLDRAMKKRRCKDGGESRGVDTMAINLIDALRRIRNDAKALGKAPGQTTRIAVVGGFSAGKSAFINHVLGEDVACEGVNPTTMSTTEYVYSNAQEFSVLAASGDHATRHLTKDEYMAQSKAEGVKRRFRVALPSDFLRGRDVVIIDTPGFENERADSAIARDAIRSANIVLWLEHVSGGTVKDSNLTELHNTLATEAKPLAVIMTHVDGVKSDRTSSAAEKVECVRSQIVTEMRKKGLRLVKPPLAFSSKPEKARSSVLKLLEKQDSELQSIINLAKSQADREWRKFCGRTEERSARLLEEMHATVRSVMENLRDLTKSNEEQIRTGEKTAERTFDAKLLNVVRRHIHDVAAGVTSGNNAIESSVYESGWIWDSYKAAFNPSTEFMDADGLYRKIGDLLAKCTDFRHDKYPCGEMATHIVDAMKNIACPSYDDSWSDSARSNARETLARRIKAALGDWACGGELESIVKKHFTMPPCEWKTPNLDAVRLEQQACRQYLAVLKAFEDGAAPQMTPKKKEPPQEESDARCSLIPSLAFVFGRRQG